MGKNRGASLGSSNVSSEEARQPPPNHIPLIVCDEITEGDTPPQTRGFDTGVSADNLLLQCTEPESDIEVSIQEIENEGRTFNFGKQSRIPKGAKDYSPSQAKDLARKSSAADDDPNRITSARSRRGSEYGHGSPKRQGESYVERLAKSRVRNSASQRPKDQQNSVRNEILEADDIYFAKFLEQQSYAKRGLWNSTNFSKHASQFHSTLADLVSEDIRQSPHRSMSFTSTPLSLTDNRKTRKLFSPAEHIEVNDADFDSDGEDKSKSRASKFRHSLKS